MYFTLLFLSLLVICTIITSTLAIKKYYKNLEYQACRDKSQSLINKGQYEAAIPYLREAVRIDPKSIASLSELGKSLVISGHIDEGINILYQATHASSGFPSTYFYLGQALQKKRQMVEARNAWKKVIEIDGEGPWGKQAKSQLDQLFKH